MPTRWEQVQSLASQLAQLRIHSLANDYYNTFREGIARTSSENVANWAHRLLRRDRAVLVLAGDSKVVAPTLTKYAQVNVVSPTQGFRITNQLPRAQ
jgi:predicted Zn-dependent peptidase